MEGECLVDGVWVFREKNWVSDMGFGLNKDDLILLFTFSFSV